MSSLSKIEWQNPYKKIWGFHVHQELPFDDFINALALQKNAATFLKENHIPIDNDDVLTPGYGPHLDYMWELRVESAKYNILEKMGLAISYMAINRFRLSAYIHPLMHDPSLSEEMALRAEGHENQANALWFSHRVPQNQDFFFNPPKDEHNQIIDTRTARIMSAREKEELTAGALNKEHQSFKDPSLIISNGFHIHMDFSNENEALALQIFDKFMVFLLNENLRPTSTRLYAPYENGPHVLGGWEVKFETSDPSILSKIGIPIGWLMCNRQGLSVFIHPVTWREGDHEEELKAHEQYSFFLGFMPDLELEFFSNKIPSAQDEVNFL
ncbi:Dopa 4,5-dioxygenase family [Legionella moravica]|uniref:Aromatic ring-cleaving dioxygenase n=1 Tax=Legionella moravica TaxID=39962 RepID=A0A378JRD9_9GAMM|nr:DOPA 4,5-dioxygenase family protein [Legionella moravica]KTD31192.1 Dopa 4,5-dioxygenase family [Legionella moravica]STX61164.1 Aromatic ring-cleaving dioxygenase [Legionella moravica]